MVLVSTFLISQALGLTSEQAPLQNRNLQGDTHNQACGNGVIETGELCDDFNIIANDGCDDTCQPEANWVCENAGVPCIPICGDDVVVGNEECDNVRGCQSNCQAMPNWTCDSSANTCAERCGAYHSEFSSCCDDRNLDNNDGCSSDCLVEDGWSCNRGFCTPICGDGVITDNEKCDNVTGCDPYTCTSEYGYACSPDTNECVPHCGDGIVQFDQGESCDYGDVEVEGCKDCRVEHGWYC